MKRPKTWRTSAAEKEAAARAALPPPVPGSPAHAMLKRLDAIYPGIASPVAPSTADQTQRQNPHDALHDALKKSIDGMMRAGGRRDGDKGSASTRRTNAIVDALRKHHPEWIANRTTANMHAAVDWLTKEGIVPRGSLLPDSLARKLRRAASK